MWFLIFFWCKLLARCVDCHARGGRPGFTFSYFYRIPPIAGNEISAEISPNFANSERKENSNSKTKFWWIPTEISVISTEIRWFSTGKWCQLWFSYCSRGQMKNFWIPTLFIFSRSTTFVSGTFSFEQWFESYLIISKTTNLKSCHFMWQLPFSLLGLN